MKIITPETLAKLFPVPTGRRSYAHRITGIIPIEFFLDNETAIRAGIKAAGYSVRYRYRGPRYDIMAMFTLKRDATGVTIYR